MDATASTAMSEMGGKATFEIAAANDSGTPKSRLTETRNETEG